MFSLLQKGLLFLHSFPPKGCCPRVMAEQCSLVCTWTSWQTMPISTHSRPPCPPVDFFYLYYKGNNTFSFFLSPPHPHGWSDGGLFVMGAVLCKSCLCKHSKVIRKSVIDYFFWIWRDLSGAKEKGKKGTRGCDWQVLCLCPCPCIVFYQTPALVKVTARNHSNEIRLFFEVYFNFPGTWPKFTFFC